MSFEIGVAFGAAWGGVNSKLGFTVSQSTTETFSRATTKSVSVYIPADTAMYRDIGFDYGFVDLSKITEARKSPLG